jgi:hypothetical protein
VSNVCRTFYLAPLRLTVPMKATASSVHFSAAIIIRSSVFSKLRVNFCRFHIISVTFLHQTMLLHESYAPSALPLVVAIPNGRQKPVPPVTRPVGLYLQTQTAEYSKTNTFRNTKPTPQASNKLHRQLHSSSSRFHFIFKETNNEQSHVLYQRDAQRQTED